MSLVQQAQAYAGVIRRDGEAHAAVAEQGCRALLNLAIDDNIMLAITAAASTDVVPLTEAVMDVVPLMEAVMRAHPSAADLQQCGAKLIPKLEDTTVALLYELLHTVD